MGSERDVTPLCPRSAFWELTRLVALADAGGERAAGQNLTLPLAIEVRVY